MLLDYRNWLESELKLLGNATHHAYAFGQANMAKRALERFEADCAEALAREEASAGASGELTTTRGSANPRPDLSSPAPPLPPH